MRIKQIRPVFSEFIPDKLEEGVLYISERYKTVLHKCACGCGEEVVTPLSPVEWKLRRDGDQISLYPSIGNWNYACRSHYWIRKNAIHWAGSMSKKQIAEVQMKDRADKAKHINQINRLKEEATQPQYIHLKVLQDQRSWLSKAIYAVIKWLKNH